jgi:hypothetical protein
VGQGRNSYLAVLSGFFAISKLVNKTRVFNTANKKYAIFEHI